MAASLRSYTVTDGGFDASSTVVPRPAGVQPGDLLVALWFASKEQTDVPPNPAGWQRLGASSPLNVGANGRSTVWTRYATAAEPAYYSMPGACGGLTTIVLALTGATTTGANGPVWVAGSDIPTLTLPTVAIRPFGYLITAGAIIYGPGTMSWSWSGATKITDGNGGNYERVSVSGDQTFTTGTSSTRYVTSSVNPGTSGQDTQAMALFIPGLDIPPGTSLETDTAFPQRATATFPMAQVAEADTAGVLPTPPLSTNRLVTALDTQTADVLARPAIRTVGVPVESDTALPLHPAGTVHALAAAEHQLALPQVDTDTDFDLALAVADVDRVPILSVQADWNRNGNYDHALSDLTGLVESVTITRELAGELPAEVGLVEGYAAASMTVTIAGQFDPGDGTADGITAPNSSQVDAVAAFAPYNPDAPLFGYPTIGTPVTCDLGFLTQVGRSLRRRFTGSVSSINPSSADRDVQIAALDSANMVRASITQAPVGLDSVLLAKYGDRGYFARYNSQWLIDRCLRANGIYASPPPANDYCFLSVTMHGSQVPEVGGGGVPQQYSFDSPATVSAWTNEDHPFGMLAPHPSAPPPAGNWYADVVLTMGTNIGVGFSGWVRMPNSAQNAFMWGIVLNADQSSTGADVTHEISFEIDGGYPSFFTRTPTEGFVGGTASDYTIPALPTWMFMGCHWAFSGTSVTMTVNINGSLYHYSPSITVTAQLWAPVTTVYYEFDVPATNLSWWKDPNPPEGWVGESWVSQADIDPGLNEWLGIPELSGEDSWSLITEVTDAESAQSYFDPSGRFKFLSRAVTRSRGVPAVVTSQRELADMVTTTDEAGVRNSISTTLTPLLVGDNEWVIKSTDPDLFQSGPGTSYFDVTLPDGVVIADSPYICNWYTTDGWNQLSDTYPYTEYLNVAAVNFFSQTTLVSDTLFTIGLFRKDSATLTVAVYNRTGVTIVFKTPDVITTNTDGTTTTTAGVPAFKVPGRRLTNKAGAPQVIEDPGSIALYGPRTFELGGSGGSRWHQHPEAVAGIAEGVLGATGHPVPVLDAVEVPHDPTRQLGDAITVADPYGLGSVTGTITGITTNLTTQDPVTDQLTVRPLAPPSYGVFDDPVLGQIGETLRFGP